MCFSFVVVANPCTRPGHTRAQRLLVAILAVAAGCWYQGSSAQTAALPSAWVWINASGIKTYSDVAPPPGTPDKNILQRPGQFVAQTPLAVASAAASAASAPLASASRPRVTGKDPELEKKIKADEDAKKAAEAATAKAEADKEEAKRQTACENLRRNQAALQSENRIARINSKGEREMLSDEARAAEIKRNEGNLAECNKG